MNTMTPFKDETITVCGPENGITIENGEVINFYGDVQITKETRKEEIDTLIKVLEKIKESLLD